MAFRVRPSTSSSCRAGDTAAIARTVGEDVAAVIVEPVQGVAGAVDLGGEWLHALRARCTAAGALLVFDEVQCGMGRTGYPFAANLYGVTPDMITTAKALGAGLSLRRAPDVRRRGPRARHRRPGTTFGGGPLACAMMETVIDIIEQDGLLANVRRLGALLRETCVVGPVTAVQGAGFLAGLRTRRPAKNVQSELLARGILTGTSADPNVVRILAPYVLEERHVVELRDALAGLAP
jgi:acetylornithine/succinyldiaminopimelate/putrescine aminotransferase